MLKSIVSFRPFVYRTLNSKGYLSRVYQRYGDTSTYFHFRYVLHREKLHTSQLCQRCSSKQNLFTNDNQTYVLSNSKCITSRGRHQICVGDFNTYPSKYHNACKSLWNNVNVRWNCGPINRQRNFNTCNSLLYSKQTDDHTPTENEKEKDQKENIYTVPNLLTGFRIVVTPYIGYLVLNGNFTVAMGLFAAAGITDALDGYIARNFKNQSSTLGSLLDPFADKLLVGVLSVTLTMVNLIPVPLMLIMVGRDVSLIIASLVIKYRSMPPPRKLSQLFDAHNATVQMLPSTLSKVNTGLQLTLLTASIGAPVFGYVDHLVLQALWYITGATTIASGIGYAVTGTKNVKFLDKDKDKE